MARIPRVRDERREARTVHAGRVLGRQRQELTARGPALGLCRNASINARLTAATLVLVALLNDRLGTLAAIEDLLEVA